MPKPTLDAASGDKPKRAPAAPGDYPRMLYHDTAKPIVVEDADAEEVAEADGYGRDVKGVPAFVATAEEQRRG